MRDMKQNPYTERFYASQPIHSSAEAILPPLIQALRPSSIVDVGCGVGTWLSTACAAGVTDVLGLDGPWIQPSSLEMPPRLFRAVDLREAIRVDRRFDLALCMETGEHLPNERSAGLVSDLVRLAPAVLFSAAVPGQGGTDHINEQWPDFWAGLFASHDYACVDAVRWKYWMDERVEFWYAQNAFLYVEKDIAIDNLPAPDRLPLRIVHPENFARHLDPQHIPVRLAIEAVRSHVLRSVKRVLRVGKSGLGPSKSWRE